MIVAIVGASSNQRKFGNKALRAFRHAGHIVIPINPHETEIEGERAYASVLDYEGDIDEATVYVPPHIGLRVIDEIAQKKIKTVWLNPGADGDAVVKRAKELGLKTRVACSIIGVGESPGAY